jgi:hypothetical protein
MDLESEISRAGLQGASAESWNTTDRMSRAVYMSAVSHTTFRARLKPDMRWLERLLLVARSVLSRLQPTGI